MRTGLISKSDVLNFVQEKGKKTYKTPFDFFVESKEEFDQNLASAPKGTKVLPWKAKEVVGKPYRIRFRRHATTPEDQSDTAFYFDTLEEVPFNETFN